MLSSARLIRPVLRLSTSRFRATFRPFSTTPTTPKGTDPPAPKPPEEIKQEMVEGIQDATLLFIRHGLGMQRLKEISKDKDSALVHKWQRMMEAYLGTQVHVLAGLGYPPDEKGVALYNQHLAFCVQDCSPEKQEEFRSKGRDTWREVLSLAFDADLENFEEVSIVEARNIMHRVSEKMQDPKILEEVAKRCASIVPTDDKQMDMAQKHHIVQEILVNEVYLGGEPSLVSECGFGDGESGYVRMQCVMAEHQNDPLVAQYIGTAMMKLLTSAGIDMQAMQQANS